MNSLFLLTVGVLGMKCISNRLTKGEKYILTYILALEEASMLTGEDMYFIESMKKRYPYAFNFEVKKNTDNEVRKTVIEQNKDRTAEIQIYASEIKKCSEYDHQKLVDKLIDTYSNYLGFPIGEAQISRIKHSSKDELKREYKKTLSHLKHELIRTFGKDGSTMLFLNSSQRNTFESALRKLDSYNPGIRVMKIHKKKECKSKTKSNTIYIIKKGRKEF